MQKRVMSTGHQHRVRSPQRASTALDKPLSVALVSELREWDAGHREAPAA